ncbi:nitrous oxide-stimulated promoter family protein [Clostridium botulinum]|uniref:nitrous oxide-stimulated promoter family protein n=1 Tax=Clostridium botulinum TaxID=1491 RepID=UPI0013CC8815|nr:nitrous oxide-stimulated promoter family protein [Clostridium botulinum]NFN19117.1 nitrous oxide-stimulated promoter family protein [Clostridium botulinum]NFN49591.1 nitrous oxide-stimulated promoter family protein [Clostridium botulinum]
MRKIENEKKVIKLMIEIYCRKKHGHKKELCPECNKLLSYAYERLDYCKFGDKKSICAKCPIHCYKKDMKTKVKEIMRFSGPRLIIYKPIELIKHLLD